LAAVLALSAGRAAAEVVDEIVAKVNEDIVTKSDLESEEQTAVQDLYRQYSGTDLDTRVAQAKSELLRHLIDRRVLVQRAGHLFDMSKMQEYFLTAFKENQNIKSDRGRTARSTEHDDGRPETRLIGTPRRVIRAEIVERIAVSEKEDRDYYDAPEGFPDSRESTVRRS
jgi:parvulin-like peptidyl-prolyl isomerase